MSPVVWQLLHGLLLCLVATEYFFDIVFGLTLPKAQTGHLSFNSGSTRFGASREATETAFREKRHAADGHVRSFRYYAGVSVSVSVSTAEKRGLGLGTAVKMFAVDRHVLF